jgi:hypothetical protein
LIDKSIDENEDKYNYGRNELCNEFELRVEKVRDDELPKVEAKDESHKNCEDKDEGDEGRYAESHQSLLPGEVRLCGVVLRTTAWGAFVLGS